MGRSTDSGAARVVVERDREGCLAEEPPGMNLSLTQKEKTNVSTGSPVPRPADGPGAVAAAQADVTGHSVHLRDLHAFYGEQHAVKGVNLDFPAGEVTAIIGPSGCGKSTMVRCINRMHEEIPGARATGEVKLDELDVYGEGGG